jgi:phosphate transport system protein
MGRYLDQHLAQLRDNLLTMASRAETVVNLALKALTDRDDVLARRVIATDELLDHGEVELDEVAINMLVKGPVASDLRLITMAMKISHDLERVGDEATTIARRVLELNQEPQLKPYLDIPRLWTVVVAMLKSALDAFVNGDSARARAIVLKDKEADRINEGLHEELVAIMVANPATLGRCLHLMVVCKSLERIADHAKNIAEDVVYLYEGRDIRHLLKSAGPPTKSTAEPIQTS